MIVLLVIASIGVILYGYFWMSRLDRFFAQGGFTKEPETSMQKDILLYGEQKTVGEISHTLDAAAITYDLTTEPDIKDGVTYRWIGAFFRKRYEYLLICLSAKRKDENTRTMAKCNDMIYENIFRQTGITVILQNDVPADRILAFLKG